MLGLQLTVQAVMLTAARHRTATAFARASSSLAAACGSVCGTSSTAEAVAAVSGAVPRSWKLEPAAGPGDAAASLLWRAAAGTGCSKLPSPAVQQAALSAVVRAVSRAAASAARHGASRVRL